VSNINFSKSLIPQNFVKFVKFNNPFFIFLLNIILFLTCFVKVKQILTAYLRIFKSKKSMKFKIEEKASCSSKIKGISLAILSKA
jgi:hypothetical protein